MVRWTQLRCEDARTPAEQMPDLSAVGSFTFDAADYEATLGAAVTRLQALAQHEREAEARWRGQRTLPARLRRLLTPTAGRRGRAGPRQR